MLQFLDEIIKYADELAPFLRNLPTLIRDYGAFVGLSLIQLRRRYPARSFRYLIPFSIMSGEARARKRPLRVAEIGIGTGQMKRFTDAMQRLSMLEGRVYEKWHGFTKTIQTREVGSAGYDSVTTLDADTDPLPDLREIDCVLLIHVLEHLKDPEQFLSRLIRALPDEALVIGGMPAVPAPLRVIWSRQLTHTLTPGGHQNAFSVRRLRKIARQLPVEERLVTGNFLVRWSGSRLEDVYAWASTNIALARAFPAWTGEVTFAWTKRCCE